MRVGQQVRFLEDQSIGTILRIGKEGVLFLDENGFEYLVKQADLVLHEPEFYNSVPIQAKKEEQKKYSKKNKIPMHTVDLHKYALIKSTMGKAHDANEVLFLQKQNLLDALDYCRENKIKRLNVIYGIGQGVVQRVVFDILDACVGIEYESDPFFQNQTGNTVVYFR